MVTEPATDDAQRWRTLGQRLRTAREQLDLTQQRVADQLGASISTLSAWESGHRAPPVARLPLLEGVLQLSPGELSQVLTGRSGAAETRAVDDLLRVAADGFPPPTQVGAAEFPLPRRPGAFGLGIDETDPEAALTRVLQALCSVVSAPAPGSTERQSDWLNRKILLAIFNEARLTINQTETGRADWESRLFELVRDGYWVQQIVGETTDDEQRQVERLIRSMRLVGYAGTVTLAAVATGPLSPSMAIGPWGAISLHSTQTGAADAAALYPADSATSIVDLLRAQWSSLNKEARRLAEFYGQNQTSLPPEETYRFEQMLLASERTDADDRLLFKSHPSHVTIPDRVFDRWGNRLVEAREAAGHDAAAWASWVQRMRDLRAIRKATFQQLTRGDGGRPPTRYLDLVSDRSLEMLARRGEVAFDDWLIRHIPPQSPYRNGVTPDDVRAHLSALKRMLEDLPGYELAIVRDDAIEKLMQRVYYTIKGPSAILECQRRGSDDSQSGVTDLYCRLDEQLTVSGLQRHFNAIWARFQSDKREVAAQLDAYLELVPDRWPEDAT